MIFLIIQNNFVLFYFKGIFYCVKHKGLVNRKKVQLKTNDVEIPNNEIDLAAKVGIFYRIFNKIKNFHMKYFRIS